MAKPDTAKSPPTKATPLRAIPKTLGACADALYTARAERHALNKEAAAIEEFEKRLKDHIIATLPKSDSTGVAGKIARVTTVTKMVPTVEDWPKFHAYVKKTGAFELLQKRLADTAINERWDAGKTVPGVVPFNVVTVSVTKVTT